MTFKEVKDKVISFLHNSRNGDPANSLNTYFAGIPEESRIREAEELLPLLAGGTTRPQTYRDMTESGNPGVIILGTHYAYPLLLAVLGWWVYAVYSTETAKELTSEGKLALYKRLKDGIHRWDWLGLDAHHYDVLFNQLVRPEPQSKSKPRVGLLRKLKSLFCGS